MPIIIQKEKDKKKAYDKLRKIDGRYFKYKDLVMNSMAMSAKNILVKEKRTSSYDHYRRLLTKAGYNRYAVIEDIALDN